MEYLLKIMPDRPTFTKEFTFVTLEEKNKEISTRFTKVMRIIINWTYELKISIKMTKLNKIPVHGLSIIQ